MIPKMDAIPTERIAEDDEIIENFFFFLSRKSFRKFNSKFRKREYEIKLFQYHILHSHSPVTIRNLPIK